MEDRGEPVDPPTPAPPPGPDPVDRRGALHPALQQPRRRHLAPERHRGAEHPGRRLPVTRIRIPVAEVHRIARHQAAVGDIAIPHAGSDAGQDGGGNATFVHIFDRPLGLPLDDIRARAGFQQFFALLFAHDRRETMVVYVDDFAATGRRRGRRSCRRCRRSVADSHRTCQACGRTHQ